MINPPRSSWETTGGKVTTNVGLRNTVIIFMQLLASIDFFSIFIHPHTQGVFNLRCSPPYWFPLPRLFTVTHALHQYSFMYVFNLIPTSDINAKLVPRANIQPPPPLLHATGSGVTFAWLNFRNGWTQSTLGGQTTGKGTLFLKTLCSRGPSFEVRIYIITSVHKSIIHEITVNHCLGYWVRALSDDLMSELDSLLREIEHIFENLKYYDVDQHHHRLSTKITF